MIFLSHQTAKINVSSHIPHVFLDIQASSSPPKLIYCPQEIPKQELHFEKNHKLEACCLPYLSITWWDTYVCSCTGRTEIRLIYYLSLSSTSSFFQMERCIIKNENFAPCLFTTQSQVVEVHWIFVLYLSAFFVRLCDGSISISSLTSLPRRFQTRYNVKFILGVFVYEDLVKQSLNVRSTFSFLVLIFSKLHIHTSAPASVCFIELIEDWFPQPELLISTFMFTATFIFENFIKH